MAANLSESLGNASTVRDSTGVLRLTNARSSLFGEAPSFGQIKQQKKAGVRGVFGANFWYYFRVYLPLITLVSLATAFVVPLVAFNQTDGFIFFGSLLSILGGILVILSYLHIIHWRKHPSALILQTSVMSTLLSLVLAVNSGNLTSLQNGTEIENESNKHGNDHAPSCMAMSFFVQFALLSREMWILSLSLDLFASITNPFASYSWNLRKYTIIIWITALASSICLISQRSCQGEFLSDGVCWIQMEDTRVTSMCVWGYYIGWLLLFFAIAVVVISYAFLKIHRGLESTYATRYCCVKDIFRVVFFYSCYNLVLIMLLSVISYEAQGKYSWLSHIFGFLIAVRGYFDSLVWFFSHSFSSDESSDQYGNHDAEGSRARNSVRRQRKATQPLLSMHKQLKMTDILRFGLVMAAFSSACRRICGMRPHDEDEDDEVGQYKERETGVEKRGANVADKCLLNPLLEEGGGTAAGEMLGGRRSSSNNNTMSFVGRNESERVSDSVKLSSNLSSHMATGADTQLGDSSAADGETRGGGRNGGGHSHYRRDALHSAAVAELKMGDGMVDAETLNMDLSPQLNYALRTELLHWVTFGVRESVERLNQRDVEYEDAVRMWTLLIGAADQRLSTSALASGGDDPSHSSHGRSASPSSSSGWRGGGGRSGVGGGGGHSYNYNYSTNYAHHHDRSHSAKSGLQYLGSQIVCTLLGSHIPGEYGVDSMGTNLSQVRHASFSQSISASLSLSSARRRGVVGVGGLSTVVVGGGGGSSIGGITPRSSMSNLAGAAIVTTTGVAPPLKSDLFMHNIGGEAAAITATTTGGGRAVNDDESSNSSHSYLGNVLSEAAVAANAAAAQDRLDEELDAVSAVALAALPPPPVPPAAPAEVVFDMDSKHQFRDFRPATFRKLRELCGLTEKHYLELISLPTKERLAEGGSGAFFFYCGNGELIVKTVSKSEGKTLLAILDKYLQHLNSHPHSFLARFLGLHSIRMYGNEFMFVVMKNILPPKVIVNERYDIKGSWVNRSATQGSPGSRATCRHCSEYFTLGSSENCSEVIGGHEPLVTLKDNDMINKLRLQPDHAYRVIENLTSDSDALCAMGVTDYSLLVGVKVVQYDVAELIAAGHGNRVAHQSRYGLNNVNFGTGPIGRERSSVVMPSLAEDRPTMFGDRERDTLASIRPTTYSMYDGSTTMFSEPNQALGSFAPVGSCTQDGISTTLEEATSLNMDAQGADAGMVASENNKSNSNNSAFEFPARAVLAPASYYMGVIDILETWTWRKRLERFFKTVLLGQSGEGVSCMCPEDFKARFQQKVARIIEHSIFIREITGSWRGKREMTVPLTLASGNRARTSTSTALVGPGNETERGSQSQSGYTGSDDVFNTETCDTENTQNAVEPKKSQER